MIYAKRVKKTNQKKVMDSGQSDIRHNGHGIRGFETSMPLHLAPHAPPRAARSFWFSGHAPTRPHAQTSASTCPHALTRLTCTRASRAHQRVHAPHALTRTRASRAHAPHAPRALRAHAPHAPHATSALMTTAVRR